MLVNGWVDWPFRVGSGVRQGCSLSPLLYTFTIDPFIRRLENGPLCGVPLGIAGEPPLRVVVYADDVSVFISGTGEAQEGVTVMDQYSETSGFKVNRDEKLSV